jgi:hypothetical protein
MENKVKYFNFPIQLLEGVLAGRHNEVFNNIVHYATYDRAIKMFEKDPQYLKNKFEESIKYFDIFFDDNDRAYEASKALFNKFEPKKEGNPKPPKVGINRDVLLDYKINVKTAFELASLVAYLALKSIVQRKPYCKITNRFWLSRMDGKAQCILIEQLLTKEVIKYSNEYQLKKIKSELTEKWGLVQYGRYTRGFYVSFTMKLDDLVYQVEKKRKMYQKKKQKKNQEDALSKAMARLENEFQN